MGWGDGPQTYRQFLAWAVWLGDESNNPSRTDYQIMRVAQEVARDKNGRAPDLDSFRVPFEVRGLKKSKAKPMTVEEASRIAKERSLSRMTLPPREVKISRAEAGLPPLPPSSSTQEANL